MVPMTQPAFFQMFSWVKIGHEIRENDNTFPEIKERNIRRRKKHQIEFFLGEFIWEKYLFTGTPRFHRGFYSTKTRRFGRKFSCSSVAKKEYIFVRIFIFHKIGNETLHIFSYISTRWTIGTTVYSDSHTIDTKILHGKEYRDFSKYCNEIKTRIFSVFLYTSR